MDEKSYIDIHTFVQDLPNWQKQLTKESLKNYLIETFPMEDIINDYNDLKLKYNSLESKYNEYENNDMRKLICENDSLKGKLREKEYDITILKDKIEELTKKINNNNLEIKKVLNLEDF